MTQKTKGVIFDIDGTLLDSNEAHAQAWLEALKEFGYTVTFEKMRKLIGMGGDKLLQAAISLAKDSRKGQQISERRTALFQEKYLPDLKPTPGTHELLTRLKQASLRLAIATSAKKAELDGLLKAARVSEFFEEKTSSSDAKNSKPDPDIIQAALHKLKMEATEVVMVGDSPYDIEAAGKAGLKTVALRCGGWSDSELRDAFAIYNDPADLLENYVRADLGWA